MQEIGQLIRIENSSIYFSNFLMSQVNLTNNKLFELKNCFMFHFENFYLENLSYIGNSTMKSNLFEWFQCMNKGYSKISNLTLQRFINQNGILSNTFVFSIFLLKSNFSLFEFPRIHLYIHAKHKYKRKLYMVWFRNLSLPMSKHCFR